MFKCCNLISYFESCLIDQGHLYNSDNTVDVADVKVGYIQSGHGESIGNSGEP